MIAKYCHNTDSMKHFANANHLISINLTVSQKRNFLSCMVLAFFSVHPEMVDFGFRQGPSEFSTAGIARYFED
jgi:hypothetical protein